MSHEVEIAQLRNQIDQKEGDIQKLNAFVTRAESSSNQVESANTGRLEIDASEWQDMTTDQQANQKTLSSHYKTITIII